jgi:hypothetical protein
MWGKRKIGFGMFCCALLLSFLQPPRISSQTIEENLSTLESLIDSSLSSIESIEQDNEALRRTLENLQKSLQAQSLLLTEQGKLLTEQALNYDQQRLIYEAQKEYSAALQIKLKHYKTVLILAAPICAGLGVLLGLGLGPAGN